MKVLLVSSMAQIAGTERATQQIAEILVEGGHEVHLLCSDGPLVPLLQDKGVKIHLADVYGINPATVYRFIRTASRLLTDEHFDCVHVQMARPVPLLALANLLAGKPGKIIWHSRGLQARTYRYLPRLFESMGVRCIANCRGERDKLIRFGYNPDHVGYLYNPCALEGIELARGGLRTQLGIAPDAVVIGCLSRLARDRGVHYAVDYFQALAAQLPGPKSAYLLIGGDGPEMGSLREQARRSPLADRIVFLGAVSDVVSFYASLDLLWNPIAIPGDQGAGTGNTTIEAAFCGVPMVSHAGAGIGELVEDGVTGGLHPVGDSAGFIESSLKLLLDQGYRARIVTAAAQRVQSLCGKKNYLQQLESYYRDL